MSVFVASPRVLGKDCQISGSGISNSDVRSASYTMTAKEVEYQPYGQRAVVRYTTGYEVTVEVELIADPNLYPQLLNGQLVSITGSSASGDFVITNIVRNEPLDDVATIKLTLKAALYGAA